MSIRSRSDSWKPLTCEECFESSGLQEAIENGLEFATATITIVIQGGERIDIPADANTIEQLCPLLEGHSDVLVETLIEFIYGIEQPKS